jgi:hypothetical protein
VWHRAGMAEPVELLLMQARSGLERMFSARSGPRYQAWPATSSDAATAQLEILVTLAFEMALA